MIIGSPTSKGHSTSGQKTYVRAIVEKHPKERDNTKITFKVGKAKYLNHDDALVISVRIANTQVKRVMVDTGSFADVLYLDAFQKLSLIEKDLTLMTLAFIGLIEDSISPLGNTTMPITVGEEPRSKTLMVTFMVVNLPLAYNVIPSRGTLNKLRAIVSTYH